MIEAAQVSCYVRAIEGAALDLRERRCNAGEIYRKSRSALAERIEGVSADDAESAV